MIDEARFVAKWRRYVRLQDEEYSPTSTSSGITDQHEELMAFLPPCEDVLDLGCGDGWSTNRLRYMGKRAVGLTCNSQEADHARSAFGLELVIHDMHDLPFEDSCFDCVYARESLEHAVAPFIVLCEVNRVLRPGGHALINVPWQDWIRYDSHYSVLTPPQIRELLYKARLRVVRSGRSRAGHYWYLACKDAELGEPIPFNPPDPNNNEVGTDG